MSYLKNLKSSVQSHPLWLSLYLLQYDLLAKQSQDLTYKKSVQLNGQLSFKIKENWIKFSSSLFIYKFLKFPNSVYGMVYKIYSINRDLFLDVRLQFVSFILTTPSLGPMLMNWREFAGSLNPQRNLNVKSVVQRPLSNS